MTNVPVSDNHRTKVQRLYRLCHILYGHPHGLDVNQLARLCEVSVRMCRRDLDDLDAAGVPLAESDERPKKYSVIRGYYIPPLHLDLDDALSLYLAARLLARYADNFDPHIAQALAKLAEVLPEGVSDHIHASVAEMAQRPANESVTEVLSTLAMGWSAKRLVRIQHRSGHSENTHTYDLAPYLIEPSAVGNATYVIGHASWFNDIHTFKVERIQSARLLDESFEVPEDFDGLDHLRDAWGIWTGDSTEDVVLRFTAESTRRVCETYWHPSQELEKQDDGGCILRMAIANPHEMTYWVRGWGANVEVIEPTWMRQELVDEASKLLEVYGHADD